MRLESTIFSYWVSLESTIFSYWVIIDFTNLGRVTCPKIGTTELIIIVNSTYRGSIQYLSVSDRPRVQSKIDENDSSKIRFRRASSPR